MKVFISVGMSSRNEEDVRKDIARATSKIQEKFKNYDVEIVHNYDIEGPENAGRMWYLGNAIVKMDKCDAIFFTTDYHEHKGCLIEENVARFYGLERIYE